MIVVDVETTGLDPQRHAILSIGAVDFLQPEREFYAECRPWHGAEITDEALEVNGFTRDQLLEPDRTPLEQAIRLFNRWACGAEHRILAGQHVVFDVAFLQASYERCALSWRFGRRTVDLHAIAYCHWLRNPASVPLVPLKMDRTSNLSLDNILTWLGLPPEPRPYNALTGARCAAEAFRELIRQSTLQNYGKWATL